MLSFFGLNTSDYIESISLSQECLFWLGEEIIDNDVYNIIEFGSGRSTQFMIDLCEKHDLDVHIDSIDHTDSFFEINTYRNPNYNLIIRDLIECSDDDKEEMFNQVNFDRAKFKKIETEHGWNQKNRFYDLKEDDLKDQYQIAIIDGPNGNGRVFSYLILDWIMPDGGYIIIDDSLHHDFIDKLGKVFKYETILESNIKSKNYMIVRIL